MSAKRRSDRGLMRWGSVPAAFLLLTLLGAMAVAGLRAPTVVAQGTPEAPMAGDCVAPELPPGTPTPMEEMGGTPMAEHDMGGTPMAEVAEATPEPTDAPAGTPAADDVTAAATSAIENVINCANAGNYEGYVALHTEAGLLEEFGTTNPYDALASFEEFAPPPLNLISVGDVQTYDDGRISAEVQYTVGQYQYYNERIFLVQDGEFWLVDVSDELPVAAEGDSAAFGVTLTEYAFAPNVTSVVATDILIIQGTNAGVEPHEIALIKLPEGADPAGLLDGSITFDQIEFIGQIFVAPGGLDEMVLLNVPAGVYTMVCFVPAPDGTPHIALGMVTQIEITEPEPVATPAA